LQFHGGFGETDHERRWWPEKGGGLAISELHGKEVCRILTLEGEGIMRKGLVVLLAAVLVVAFALPAMADVSFFGYARVIPTYYSNFDFDKNTPDAAIATEAGNANGETIRAELRLGWKAGGDKWKIMMTTESDLLYSQFNVDRSSGSNGSFFGIERAEFTYAFSPALELITGWPISAADIGTGGVLYGDDHPIIGFRGKVTDNFKYQLLYIPIVNAPVANQSTVSGDWRAYLLKPEFSFGTGGVKMSLNPILMFSDNRANNAKIMYYGLEGIGQFGFIKPSFEVIYADGEFRGTSRDIKSYAAFAGVEIGLSKAFNPYIAGRYTRGDDNSGDNDVEGFVGITDIGRFTPLMGMDGNILGESMSAGTYYNSFLYSYAPDRANGGSAANNYGGFGNVSSGNNPGSKILAVGARGDVNEQFSYKAQVFGIWFDKTENLPHPKSSVKADSYAGTEVDVMLKYAFSKNFYASYIFSAFLPGDGIKDQQPSTADDTYASLHTVNLFWTY
jgi:hypothetical protein